MASKRKETVQLSVEKRKRKRKVGSTGGEGVYGPRIDISRRDLRFTGNNPISRERCGVGANDESWPAGPPRTNHRGDVAVDVIRSADKRGPFSLSLPLSVIIVNVEFAASDKSRSILSRELFAARQILF